MKKRLMSYFFVLHMLFGYSSELQASPITQCYHDHPLLTATVATAAALIVWYEYVQIASKNTLVEVDLVTFDPEDCDEKKENFLFAAGIAETHNQAFWYAKKTDDLPSYRYQDLMLPYTMDGRIFTYDYPDATSWFWRVNWTQTGLGQHNEIQGLADAYNKAVKKVAHTKNKDIVLMGMSRGATTILNFVGSHIPEHVKAVVVESPFTATRALAKHMLSKIYLDHIPGMQTVAHALVSVAFWQHSMQGENAIDAVKNISVDLPIMLVCSQEDSLVPASSTIELYKELRATGHNNVHIFVTEHGAHGRILHDTEWGVRYQNVVQAFYKKYGLYHDPELAALGQADFDATQP